MGTHFLNYETNQCVTLDECPNQPPPPPPPPFDCPAGLEFDWCGSSCPPRTCDDRVPQCDEDETWCRPGCYCPERTLMNYEGVCVTFQDCPARPEPMECADGLEYSPCGPLCSKPHCRTDHADENLFPTDICMARCEPNCYCPPGMVWNENKECVVPTECPLPPAPAIPESCVTTTSDQEIKIIPCTTGNGLEDNGIYFCRTVRSCRRGRDCGKRETVCLAPGDETSDDTCGCCSAEECPGRA